MGKVLVMHNSDIERLSASSCNPWFPQAPSAQFYQDVLVRLYR